MRARLSDDFLEERPGTFDELRLDSILKRQRQHATEVEVHLSFGAEPTSEKDQVSRTAISPVSPLFKILDGTDERFLAEIVIVKCANSQKFLIRVSKTMYKRSLANRS